MQFNADTFNMAAFCHAQHREEQQRARLDNMRPVRIRRGDFNTRRGFDVRKAERDARRAGGA